MSVSGVSEHEAEAKQKITRGGRDKLLAAVRTWVDEIHRAVPLSHQSGAAGQKESDRAESKGANGASGSREKAAKKEADAKKKKEFEAEGFGTIRMVEKFICRPGDVYEALMDPRRVMAFTQSPCNIEVRGAQSLACLLVHYSLSPVRLSLTRSALSHPFGSLSPSWLSITQSTLSHPLDCAQARVGGKVMMFGGTVEAEITALEPGKKIGQKWRRAEWPEGCWSELTMELEEPERGNTVLTLEQRRVPDTDRFGNGGVVESIESGWRERVFGMMRKVFGYGHNMFA